jgi:hypothetical protein
VTVEVVAGAETVVVEALVTVAVVPVVTVAVLVVTKEDVTVEVMVAVVVWVIVVVDAEVTVVALAGTQSMLYSTVEYVAPGTLDTPDSRTAHTTCWMPGDDTAAGSWSCS